MAGPEQPGGFGGSEIKVPTGPTVDIALPEGWRSPSDGVVMSAEAQTGET